jgi:probable O-glycosylation ligase (exosortase A-associated)
VFALLLQTRRKALAAVMLVGAMIGGIMFLPQDWFDRMGTIETYDEDASTQGRFQIWALSTQIALDRPLVGGGFDVLFDRDTYVRYQSNIRPRTAHSIVFQVLGEHGFVGLFLFLMMGLSVWLQGFKVRRLTRYRADLRWAYDLASMWQVSLMGYFSAGLFLNLAFFDLVYLYIPLSAATTAIVIRETMSNPVRAGTSPPASAPAVGGALATPALGAGRG